MAYSDTYFVISKSTNSFHRKSPASVTFEIV